MIRNLFSIFDPSTIYKIPINWATLTLLLLLISNKWNYNLFNKIPKNLIKIINNEIRTTLKSSYLKINILILISILIMIIIRNLIRLLPYVYNSTRRVTVRLSIALTLWIGIIIFIILHHKKSILAHLVPQGTPSGLIPLIVIIETIRSIIRPLTLSIRLTTNIIAGHLIISLIGEIIEFKLITTLTIIPQTLLILIEIAVSVIQAYVFTILITLYIKEINN